MRNLSQNSVFIVLPLYEQRGVWGGGAGNKQSTMFMAAIYMDQTTCWILQPMLYSSASASPAHSIHTTPASTPSYLSGPPPGYTGRADILFLRLAHAAATCM
jgi:hypothetical protein